MLFSNKIINKKLLKNIFTMQINQSAILSLFLAVFNLVSAMSRGGGGRETEVKFRRLGELFIKRI